MSGHSKWHSIRHKKAAADAKRGNIFTKLSREITVAVKEMGADIDTNFKLKLAINKAKSANMPKDVIERAIKKGTGELAGDNIEEITYEGFAPGGIALVVETLTDNRNRTVTSIKTILGKNGGSLASANSVLWMFERKGIIIISKDKFPQKSDDEIELFLIESGAEDLEQYEEEESYFYRIITSLEGLKDVEKILLEKGMEFDSSGLEYIPKEEVTVDEKGKESLMKITELLEEDDDVSAVHSNMNFS